MPAQRDEVWLQVGRYLGLAAALPACVAIGYAIGWWIDNRLGTTWVRIVFLLLGIAAGFVQLIRTLLRDTK